MTLEAAETAAHVDTTATLDTAERRAVRVVIAVAVVLFWLIATSWRPWELFDRAGFSADFYDEQARSFLRGRLAVRPEVPGPEGFLIDGRTYLYYGPFLAVVRLPLAVFGDLFVGRMVILSMLVALVVIGAWSARLARAGRRVVVGVNGSPAGQVGTRSSWPVPTLVAAVLASPVLFAAGWSSVYHETELWALALALVAATLVVEWAASGCSDTRRLGWAVAAVLATTMTRAPIGFGLAAGLGLIGLVLAWRSRHERGRRGWPAVAGGALSFVAYAVVNLAKFGTLFSVPGDRQVLSITDPRRAAFFEATGGSFFDIRFLPTTVVQYLRPDAIRFERLVPGVRFGPLATNRGSLDVETVTPASSLPVTATALMVLAVVGIVWMLRHRARLWLLVTAAGVLGAVPSFLIGFVANRYLIDMLPPLVTAAAIGVWVVPWSRPGRALPALAVLLVVWGVWVNASLATWTLEAKSAGFTELRSDVDAALFGGGDVGTVVLDAAPTAPGEAPRDGIVGLAPACSATYIAEQGRWVALERAADVYERSGAIEAVTNGPRRLAATSAWTIDVLPLDVGGVAVVYGTPVDPDGVVITVPADELPVPFRVLVDPFSRETLLTVGDVTEFLPGEAADSVTTDGIAVDGVGPDRSSLCETLLGRR